MNGKRGYSRRRFGLVVSAVGLLGLPVALPAQDDSGQATPNGDTTSGETSTIIVEPAAATDADTSTLTTEPADGETSTITTEPAEGETSVITTEPAAGETSTITVEPAEGETSVITTEPAAGETSTITTEAPASSAGAGTEDLGGITVEGVWTPTQVGPQRGLRLTRDQLPANVQSATGEEIRESRATSLTDFMSTQMQSVNINEYQGNPFQADVQFRGFSASPQIGTPQGLSVFFDGIRVNEPFGDIVNWDMIPLNAIGSFDIFPGSNPLFGLNTLGGALSIRTKNGFDDPGIETSLLGGSWGRIHGQLAAGGSKGPIGGFVGLTGFHEEGWRDNSPSDVKQLFTKVSGRTGNLELDATMMLAGTDLIGNGLLPTSLYEEDPASVFTSPDETRNNLQQFSLSGLYNVTDSFNVTAQIYRRDSKRRATGGDVFEGFEDLDSRLDGPVTAQDNGGELCQYQDANNDGFLDYFIDQDADFLPDSGTSINEPITADLIAAFGSVPPLELVALNRFTCNPTAVTYQPVRNSSGQAFRYNGGGNDNAPFGTGYVDGAPIGLLSKTEIDQVTDGAAAQLNWNLDRHALMIGASIDKNDTRYFGSQRLGLIDPSHRVYADPDNIDPIYLAAIEEIINNEFDGTSTTSSAYFSETYSPFDNLHLSVAGRYNFTEVTNTLASRNRSASASLGTFRNPAARPDGLLCPASDPSSCPTSPNVNAVLALQEILANVGAAAGLPDRFATTTTTEEAIYHSFNPSFGINFLPTESTNIFFNWSQGTRAPSVVELGCAYDGTLVDTGGGPGNTLDGIPDKPRSLANGQGCTLPTTLSGDPYLPQIFARSAEFGLRGTFPNEWEWNASIYRVNLQDDIYFVGITSGQGFFDTIGETRRQGVELGLSGPINRWFDFSVNYGLTEATFESRFFMLSERNSSKARTNPPNVSAVVDETGRTTVPLIDMITVEPGDRMPGVPLHNVNASLTMHPLERLDIGISMVAHSSAYVRGNENNDHQVGAVDTTIAPGTGAVVSVRPYTDSGKVGGYALFNLKTSYRVDKHFTVFAQVNNLLDKEYFSAGRLGINPFSPSINGTIGPSGWNYNDNDWLNSTFIAPGSPRAYWIGLEYKF